MFLRWLIGFLSASLMLACCIDLMGFVFAVSADNKKTMLAMPEYVMAQIEANRGSYHYISLKFFLKTHLFVLPWLGHVFVPMNFGFLPPRY